MTREQLIEDVHASTARMLLVVTGGGTQAIADLLSLPGGSGTVLEAVVPYSIASLEQFLGGSCDQPCSARTARSLAMAAFQRAQWLSGPQSDGAILGVSCTASLTTNRVKRGAHRAFVGVQAEGYTSTATIDLDNRSRTRSQEERVVTDVILNQVAGACQVHQWLDVALDASRLTIEQIDAEPEWRQLLLADRDCVLAGTNPSNPPNAHRIVFPGAFDPRHTGHTQMAEFAARRLGSVVEFELSVENVDKPLLDYHSITNRLAPFASDETVWLTRAPTFVQKSNLFPHTTFLVGADTILRIADARYYGQDEQACCQAVKTIIERGCRFLVFGRMLSGKFVTLSELSLPGELAAICDKVDRDAFRCDVSSTGIRQANL